MIFILGAVNSYGQDKAIVDKDTARYQGRTFAVKDTIQLMYGSGIDKDFVFVLSPGAIVTSAQSKKILIIDKVFTARKSGAGIVKGKTYLLTSDNGKLLFGGQRILIDLEGAIDNKEIK